jgi:hypothetical protein
MPFCVNALHHRIPVEQQQQTPDARCARAEQQPFANRVCKLISVN